MSVLFSLDGLGTVKNLSKPIQKLIDNVGRAVGILYEPRYIRKKAEAEADAKRIMAGGEVDAKLIKAVGEKEISNLLNYSHHRQDYKEIRRQMNVYAIVKESIKYLPDTVSDDPVNEDWIFEFFNCCEDISHPQMQTIWAKLLAGEIYCPKSFGPRTLNLVKLMSVDEANLFTKFCSFVWTGPQTHFHIVGDKTTQYLRDNEDFTPNEIAELESIGLVLSTLKMKMKFFHGDVISYCGTRYKLSLDGVDDVDVGFVPLTKVGRELYPVAGAVDNQGYFDIVKSDFKNKNCELIELP